MNVILIGPIGAGKTTLGRLIATALSLPQLSLDDVRFNYYREIGYDDSIAKQRYAAEGFWGLYKYWKPFEAHAVERVLAEHDNCVIDFGAGHSVYEDEELLARVKSALTLPTTSSRNSSSTRPIEPPRIPARRFCGSLRRKPNFPPTRRWRENARSSWTHALPADLPGGRRSSER